MNALTLRAVRDGAGMIRFENAPPAKPSGRTRKPRLTPDPIRTNGETAAEELRLLVERAERIAEEIKGAQDDLADVFAEAKGRGYSPKAIRAIMTLRLKDRKTAAEEETIYDLYRQHLGML